MCTPNYHHSFGYTILQTLSSRLVDADLAPDTATFAIGGLDFLQVTVVLALLHVLSLLYCPTPPAVRIPDLLARVAALAGLRFGAIA